MPDTGAPWNLRFPAPSDLVRDAPVAFENLADDVAAGLSVANVGIGTNVVQAVKTDTLSSTSTTFTAVDGLSVTITPSAATSKVLVIAYVNGSSGNGDGEGASFRLMRGATPIAIGDADGSRDRVTGSLTVRGTAAGVKAVTVSFLDAPATASPTTYSIEGRAVAGTFRINRMSDDINTSFYPRTISSITAIEVAG
jgi:hypothetical protein